MLGAVPEGAVAINGSRAVSAYVKISGWMRSLLFLLHHSIHSR